MKRRRPAPWRSRAGAADRHRIRARDGAAQQTLVEVGTEPREQQVKRTIRRASVAANLEIVSVRASARFAARLAVASSSRRAREPVADARESDDPTAFRRGRGVGCASDWHRGVQIGARITASRETTSKNTRSSASPGLGSSLYESPNSASQISSLPRTWSGRSVAATVAVHRPEVTGFRCLDTMTGSGPKAPAHVEDAQAAAEHSAFHTLPISPALVIRATRCAARAQHWQRRSTRQVSAPYPSESRAPSRGQPFSNHTHVEAWARAARADDTESALARAPQPARPSKTHMET